MLENTFLEEYVESTGQAFGFFHELVSLGLLPLQFSLDVMNDFLNIIYELQITFNISTFKGQIEAMNTLFEKEDLQKIEKMIDNL